MSEANPTLDPIGYRCDGCGRLFKDPYADLSAIRAAGGRSCCPERKPVGLSDRIEELEAKLSESEALLAKAVAGMMALTDVSTLMQSSSSHNRFRHNTTVTDSIWSQWSTQLKFARTTLAELTGGKDE